MLLHGLKYKITPAECEQILKDADVDGNGNLDIYEFVEWATKVPKKNPEAAPPRRSKSRKER